MRERYDVIVVGARVGGSTLAALLGDAGVSVLLLDRARFPSTTPSTHFFRGAWMVGVLRRLGVLGAVLGHGCPPLTREFNYEDGGLEPVEGPPQDPGDLGYCLSVRREPLDYVLLQRARAAEAVDVIERANVSDVLWDGDRVMGVGLADGRRAHAERCITATTKPSASPPTCARSAADNSRRVSRRPLRPPAPPPLRSAGHTPGPARAADTPTPACPAPRRAPRPSTR